VTAEWTLRPTNWSTLVSLKGFAAIHYINAKRWPIQETCWCEEEHKCRTHRLVETFDTMFQWKRLLVGEVTPIAGFVMQCRSLKTFTWPTICFKKMVSQHLKVLRVFTEWRWWRRGDRKNLRRVFQKRRMRQSNECVKWSVVRRKQSRSPALLTPAVRRKRLEWLVQVICTCSASGQDLCMTGHCNVCSARFSSSSAFNARSFRAPAHSTLKSYGFSYKQSPDSGWWWAENSGGNCCFPSPQTDCVIVN